MSVVFKRAILDSDKAPAILWDNILDGATVVSSTGSGDNLLDEATNSYWTPTTLPATTTFTLSGTRGASYFGLASHTLNLNSCTITLEAYNGSSWVTVFTDTPTHNKTFMVLFNYVEASQWRITVTGSDEPSIGVVFLGQALVFESGILPGYTPIYMAENVTLLTAQTITGQFMPNRVERKGLSSSFSLNILERDFVEGDDFQAFRRYYNDGGPFFFASSPDSYRDDVAYCWRAEGGEIKPNFADSGLFYSANISLEAFID